MPIRKEFSPAGMGGQAWYVTDAADLSDLPPDAAALVPARVARIFRDLPTALTEFASRAPLASMRRWLESLRDVRCVLEVYDTEHFGAEARLRFHVDARWSPSFRGGTTGESAVPFPDVLRAVHMLTGSIDHQYGCSGTLVDLEDLRTLAELVDDEKVMNYTEFGAIFRKRPALRSFVGVYELNGDWLCVDARGRTLWAGGEQCDSPTQKADTIEAMLDRYFDSLTARRVFGPM